MQHVAVQHEGPPLGGGGQVVGQPRADQRRVVGDRELPRALEQHRGRQGASLRALGLVAHPARQVAHQHGHRREGQQHQHVLGLVGRQGELGGGHVEIVDQEGADRRQVARARPDQVGGHQHPHQEHARHAVGAGQLVEQLRPARAEHDDHQRHAVAPRRVQPTDPARRGWQGDWQEAWLAKRHGQRSPIRRQTAPLARPDCPRPPPEPTMRTL